MKDEKVYQEISRLIREGRQNAYRAIQSEMLFTYWEIGRKILEEEQRGEKRAEYGKFLLKNLSTHLTEEFGKGFDESNLRNMRLCYKTFPIRDAVRHNLSWTHYRT